MNIRSSALAVAAAALVGPAVPAHADPFVGRAGWVTGTVPLRGTDGRLYQVTFTVRRLSAVAADPAYEMQVAVAKCVTGSCSAHRTYAKALTPAEVQADEQLTSVTVQTTLLGTAATLVWTANSDPDPIPKAQVRAQNVDMSAQSADPAQLVATAWGVQCFGEGTYYQPYAVAVAGYEASPGERPTNTAPRQFAKRGKTRVQCGF